MYAGGELPAELEQELNEAAIGDLDLNRDMTTLRRTVDELRTIDDPEYTDESYHRILMKLYARGADIEPQVPVSAHFQYHLPLTG